MSDRPSLVAELKGRNGNEEALRWIEQSYQDRAGSDVGMD
jgi:hypothetical protein